MELSIYLESIVAELSSTEKWKKNTLGYSIQQYSDDIKLVDYDVALVGVMEERGASGGNKGCGSAPDRVREQLYGLFHRFENVKILDLGNIKAGNSYRDTYFALTSVISGLVKKEVVPIIIGGSHDLTYANYQAYEKLEQVVNLVTIDRSIDLGLIEEDITDSNFINHIVMHQPNFLFNYSSVGYQSYYVDQEIDALMERMHFDAYRLGSVRSNMEEIEPIVRNADILSFDISAIKSSDFSGYCESNPNGFSGEEACKITRYAGLSDKLTSIGFYNYNPVFDKNGCSAMLLSQMIWYFIEGFEGRKGDFPVATKSKYTKYHVAIEEGKHELLFYKSEFSGRWWMEVPFPSDLKNQFIRHQMVPCSYKDYEMAINGNMPNRWWQTFQKL
tara:strand:+ start:1156 stop:2319 length:1164 start_codon:yes stop_codon:yes gene_type:complete